MKNVLVTSAGTRVAYAICKNLARHGIRVYAGDSLPLPMTAFSRHCAGSFRYASPFTEEERFWDDITRFIRQKNIGVLLPALEEGYCIARGKERLNGLASVFLPEFEQILAVHDKAKLTALAERLGIPVPRSLEAAEARQRPELLDDLTCPLLLKPKQGGGGWAMQRFTATGDLAQALCRPDLEANRFLIQEEIEGETLCVCALYHKGNFVTGDAYRTLHAYPVPYGQATLRETVEGGRALDALKALLGHLNWNGVCEADFILDRRGEARLLDVNPRFWGSLAHNIAAGVEYPYYAYCLALGDTSFVPASARPGTRTRWLGGDIPRFFSDFFRSAGKGAFARDTLRTGAAVACHDDWDLKDPLPFAVWAAGQCLCRISGKKRDALPGLWS